MKKLTVDQMVEIEGGLSQRTACILSSTLVVIAGAATCLSGVGSLWGSVAMMSGTLGIMAC